MIVLILTLLQVACILLAKKTRLTYIVIIYCRRNLLNILDFLKKPNAFELVSGTRDRINLYEKFKNAIEASFPGTIDGLRLKAKQKKKSFWDSVTDSKVGAFKFSF